MHPKCLPPTPTSPTSATSILRRHKPSPGGKQVHFDVVTVYYFPRQQGFTSVPSQGGSSLGMARHHSAIRHYTLGEFARKQETSHRHTLRQHLRQEKLNARKMKVCFMRSRCLVLGQVHSIYAFDVLQNVTHPLLDQDKVFLNEPCVLFHLTCRRFIIIKEHYLFPSLFAVVKGNFCKVQRVFSFYATLYLYWSKF